VLAVSNIKLKKTAPIIERVISSTSANCRI
jgi:hypothetical protein